MQHTVFGYMQTYACTKCYTVLWLSRYSSLCCWNISHMMNCVSWECE